MVAFRLNYDYQWGRNGDVAELTAALAERVKAPALRLQKEAINIDAINLALLHIYKDWYQSHEADLELQALLGVAAACPWVWRRDRERLFDLLQMLDEIAEAIAADYAPTHFTEEGLRKAIQRSLGASVTSISLAPTYFEVSFVEGDYGDGPFDGAVCLLNDAFYLVDFSRRERHDFKGSVPPSGDEEVEEALASDLWRPRPNCTPKQLKLPTQKLQNNDSSDDTDSDRKAHKRVGSWRGEEEFDEEDEDELDEPINDVTSYTQRTGAFLRSTRGTAPDPLGLAESPSLAPPAPPPPPPRKNDSNHRYVQEVRGMRKKPSFQTAAKRISDEAFISRPPPLNSPDYPYDQGTPKEYWGR